MIYIIFEHFFKKVDHFKKMALYYIYKFFLWSFFMPYFFGLFLCLIAISYGAVQQRSATQKSAIVEVLPIPDFCDDSDSLQTSSFWDCSLAPETLMVFSPIIKWENVLFIKQWLSQNMHYEVPKLKHAFDLWDTHEFLSTNGNCFAGVLHCLNNVSTLAPEENDILVYNTQKFPDIGHAAVVTKMYNDKVLIAEKNPFSKSFSNVEYRELSIQKRRIGQLPAYKIDDIGLMGWIKIIKKD
ncbi:MAG: hypothetical protein NEHIOOID_00625 [Holosporales bacterium]